MSAPPNGQSRLALTTEDIQSDEAVTMSFVIEGLEARLYEDGVLKETINLPKEVPAVTKDWCVGGDNREGNGQYFKGTVYSVHVFSESRSAEDLVKDANGEEISSENLLYAREFNEFLCEHPENGYRHEDGEWIIDIEATETER